jgi:hypothetical protein
MTAANDFDRQLAAYLEEGPRQAPDRPVDAAVSYARAHPRRRDPLQFLRPDVMGRRGSVVGPQLAWAALIGLLALGAIAALAIGSRPDRQPVVPPPTAVPSPVLSASSPPPAPTTIGVELTDPTHEITWSVTVEDDTGLLVAAQAEPPSPDEPVDRISAANPPGEPTQVLLTWTFAGCPDPITVSIRDAAKTIRVERPVCEDTLGGSDLRMTLTFAQPVPASGIDVQLIEAPR